MAAACLIAGVPIKTLLIEVLMFKNLIIYRITMQGLPWPLEEALQKTPFPLWSDAGKVFRLGATAWRGAWSAGRKRWRPMGDALYEREQDAARQRAQPQGGGEGRSD
jgi:hypothetical protein